MTRTPPRRTPVGWLVLSSWLWHLTRWDGLFLCTYLVAHRGGSALAVQCVGVAMFTPMMLGSAMARRLRQGLSPRRVVLGCQFTLIPLAALFAGLIDAGLASVWTVYPLEFAFGTGLMVNMTAQRELLVRSAGPGGGAHALSLEVAGQSFAAMLGPLIGGLSIAVVGLDGAFAVLVALLIASVSVLSAVSRSRLSALSGPGSTGQPDGPSHWRAPWDTPRRLLRHRELAFTIGVTVFANLCCFSFLPLIPVIAKRLHASAAMAGVIGSVSGGVQLLVCVALVVCPVRRATAVFSGSVALALVAVGLLAYAPDVAIGVLALAMLGLGQGIFSNLQTLLTVRAVPDDDRAGALGLLTTTVGAAMPLGMVTLGLTSTVLGDQLGMLILSLSGLIALAVVVRFTVYDGRHDPPMHAAGGDPGLHEEPIAPVVGDAQIVL